MIWIISTFALLLLALLYFFLEWKSKKHLTKLRRQYDENGYKDESEREPGNWVATRKRNPRIVEPEQPIEGDVEPEPERILPTPDSIVIDEDFGKSGEDDEPRTIIVEDETKEIIIKKNKQKGIIL